MGVDYLTRKSAKKNRKGDRKDGERRVRKKKGPRRLCQGVCYQDPVLKPEDLEDEGDVSGGPAGQVPEASMESRIARELLQQHKEEQGSATDKKKKENAASKRLPQQADGEREKTGAKRRRFSTSAKLDAVPAERPLNDAENGNGAHKGDDRSPLSSYPGLIQRYMASKGLIEPTPVQERAWPVLLRGECLRAVAEPGAGKTLAFLLPGGVRLAPLAASHGPPVGLILEPTRELAQQVGVAWRDIGRLTGLQSAVIHGGVPKQEHVALIEAKPHVIIATPGRLLDLVQSNSLDLGNIQYLVLDEADRLLSMGFAPQLDRLQRLLRLDSPRTKQDRSKTGGLRTQVSLFTATFPEEVAELATAWLRSPFETIESEGPSARSISRTVTQVVQVCAEHRKPAKLQRHIAAVEALATERGDRNRPRILVFANRIKTVRFLQRLLSGQEEDGKQEGRMRRVAILHGDRSQQEREAALAEFKSGKAQILVASDVAARGLHIQNLPYVVNYDFPTTLEQYIHRVGRTGRLAAHGHAFSFFTRELAALAGSLVALLEAHQAELDPNLVKLAEAFETVKAKLGETGQLNDVLGQLGLKQRKTKKKNEDAREEEEKTDPVPEAEHSTPMPEFMAALSFEGAKAGYYFGKRGGKLGYHFDKAAARRAEAAASEDLAPSVSKKKKALPGRLRKKLMAKASNQMVL